MPIQKFLAKKNLDEFKFRRNRIVFVGDHENAQMCKELRKTEIKLYAPSHHQGSFEGGYIEFAWGRGWMGRKLFNIRGGTILGKPAFIFEYDEDIEIIWRRLKATEKLESYTKLYCGDDLKIYWTLVVGQFEMPPRFWRGDEHLRSQIVRLLPALGLLDLEALVEAARPASSAVAAQACAAAS